MESKNSLAVRYQQVLSAGPFCGRQERQERALRARPRMESPGSPGGATLWLESAAAMYTLLTGLEGSMPHLPVYADRTSAYTTVEHPGYTE